MPPSDFREVPPDEQLREASHGLTDLPSETEGSLRERALSVYGDEELFGAGLQREWARLAGPDAPRETFQEAYRAYVAEPETLDREAPKQYHFLKEHVFYGTEYRRATTLAEQVNEGIEALESFEALRPEVWEGLGVSERAAALQEVEVRLAERAGRPPVRVVVDQTMSGLNGYFDAQTGTMHLNTSFVNDSGALAQAVDTVAHEGRHAYQHHAVNNPGFHPDAAQVGAWAENLQPGNYLTAELYGYEAYRNQPVEADAWAFGEAVRDGLYGGQRA